MFGSRVGFSGTGDRMALFPVGPVLFTVTVTLSEIISVLIWVSCWQGAMSVDPVRNILRAFEHKIGYIRWIILFVKEKKQQNACYPLSVA